MAGIDEKLSQLDSAPLPIEDSDLLYVVRSGVSYKTTVGDLPSTGGGGVDTVGTINSQTKSANGAVISGNDIIMQTADTTHVGLVTRATTAEQKAGTDTAKYSTPETVAGAYNAYAPTVITSSSTLTTSISMIIATGAGGYTTTLPDASTFPASQLGKPIYYVNNSSATNTIGVETGGFTSVTFSITGATTTPPLYALNSTTLPTVSNMTIAGNVATATANNASAQTFDYIASNSVVSIIPKMTFTNGNVLTVDPSSSIGNLKLTSPFGGLLSNGSKILVDQSGIVAEIAINTVSSSTIGVPTVAASTISRAAGVLNDNIVFLSGGGIVNSYNFNPESNVITNKANNPSSAGSWYFDGACMMNNKMYCWGDVNRNNILNIYDANNNTWGSGLGPGRGVLFPISVPLNDGTIFLVGGTDSVSTSSSVTQIYNPISNTYTSRSNALGGIDSGGGLQIDNDNIVVTRYRTNGTNTSVNFWKFTLSTNTWSALNDSPTPILAPLMYLLNSDIIDVFNSGDGKRYQYTISTNTWSAALTATGVGGAYFRANGVVYCVTNAGTFYYYNYTNNTWVPIASTTQYIITSPSLSVAVPNWAALGGQTEQYSVSATSTPSFSAATTPTYTRSGNVITATYAQVTGQSGTHVQLKALTLNNGDVLSQIGADLHIDVDFNITIPAGGKYALIPTSTAGWQSFQFAG